METIRIEGFPSDKKTHTTDYLMLLLYKIWPHFQNYIEEKNNLFNKAFGFFIAGGAILLGSIFLLFQDLLRGLGVLLVILGLGVIMVGILCLLKAKKLVFKTDIIKIGKSALNFYLYPFEDGAVLVDENKITNSTSLSFSNLADINQAVKLRGNYEKLMSNLPIIMDPSQDMIIEADSNINVRSSAVFDAETKIKRIFLFIDQCYTKTKDFNVELGLIKAADSLVDFLVKNPPVHDKYIFAPSPITQTHLNQISGIIANQKGNKELIDIDKYSLSFMNEILSNSIKMSKLRTKTLFTSLSSRASRLGDLMHYGAYSFYCPYCNEEIIKDLLGRDYNVMEGKSYAPASFNPNSKMHLRDWKNETWVCQLCEREARRPLPVPKLYEQIFLPAYNSLLLENEKDRLKLYAELKDKKIHYRQQAEKEFDEIFRTNRSEIDSERSKLRTLNAQIESNRKAIDSLGDLMKKMEIMTQKEMEDATKYAQNMREQLAKEYKEVEISTQDMVNRVIKQSHQDMMNFAQLERVEQQVRDSVQRDIAENTRQNAAYNKEICAIENIRAHKAGWDKHPFIFGASDKDKAYKRISKL